MANTLDASRVADIAAQIAQTCAAVSALIEDHDSAKDLAATAGDAANGTRETIMQRIAELADAGGWLPGEIDAAAKRATTMHNNLKTAKAMGTFIGECKRAAHPAVRAHVPTLLAVRNAAWDEETAQKAMDGDIQTPLRKAFKRKYHAFIQAMAATEDGRTLNTAADLVSYAVERDPDHDASKVARRLAALTSALADFAVDFPVEAIATAARKLGEITEQDLIQSRRVKLAGPARKTVASVAAAMPNAATTVPPPNPARLARALTAQAAATVVQMAPVQDVRDADEISGDDLLDTILADNLPHAGLVVSDAIAA